MKKGEAALSGIKVVALTTWAAGPTAGTWLAEFGADVIRVEPLEGDPVRGLLAMAGMELQFNPAWEMWNRSQRGIAIDMGQDEGQEIIHKLVAQCDVFLTNLRPGVLKKARMDYETLAQLNPRLIYAHITGYGTKGPGTEWPAFDETAFWARAGFMSTMGAPGDCIPLRGAMGDHTAGLFMLGGIALALYVRERMGVGQRVDVSLLHSGVWVNGVDMQFLLSSGAEMPRHSRKSQPNPLYTQYRCKDGKWFQFQMLQADRYWPGLCRAIGREDLVARFDSLQKILESNEEIIAILDEVISTKTRDEWEPLFIENGVVCGRGQTVTEVVEDPCVLENEYIVEYEHFSEGQIKGISCPIQMEKTPPEVRGGAPEHGQHTEEVLLEMGYGWDDISNLKEKKVIP